MSAVPIFMALSGDRSRTEGHLHSSLILMGAEKGQEGDRAGSGPRGVLFSSLVTATFSSSLESDFMISIAY